MRESFKDLKKKFNNLKFNYMKKNEKSRNAKAVKNQIQQIEIYIEKLQVKKLSLKWLASFIMFFLFYFCLHSAVRELYRLIPAGDFFIF